MGLKMQVRPESNKRRQPFLSQLVRATYSGFQESSQQISLLAAELHNALSLVT